MAEVKAKSDFKIEFTVNLKLTIQEARALNEMVKYGSKAFLEGYYKQLGKSYLQPYESGVISLFETIRAELPYQLHDVDEIIKSLDAIKGLNCQYKKP